MREKMHLAKAHTKIIFQTIAGCPGAERSRGPTPTSSRGWWLYARTRPTHPPRWAPLQRTHGTGNFYRLAKILHVQFEFSCGHDVNEKLIRDTLYIVTYIYTD